jgi:hypothetical protein
MTGEAGADWAKEHAVGGSESLESAWKEGGDGDAEAAWKEVTEKQKSTDGKSHDMDATRRTTAEMARVMKENPDPKFQNSEFLKFMSSVSTGDLDFEGNEVNSLTDKSTRVARSNDSFAISFSRALSLSFSLSPSLSLSHIRGVHGIV